MRARLPMAALAAALVACAAQPVAAQETLEQVQQRLREHYRNAPERPEPLALEAREIRRWPAPEARQGAAVDGDHFYAVVNSAIGKYEKRTGARVGEWLGDRLQITHLNSCAVIEAELVCANSNFPEIPMVSSVEMFDPATLRHARSIPLGMAWGSLTWVERHEGRWWAGFAHYDETGGEPSRDHRFSEIVTFDDEWRRTGGYRFPDSVLARFAPTSNSGGSFGDDGLLYVTGHSAREIYVLRIPTDGPILEHVATIAAPLEGQAWAWDRSEERTIYGIIRSSGEVVVAQLPVVLPRLGN